MSSNSVEMPSASSGSGANKESSVVKIAVEMDNQVAQLIELNQSQPLSGIIQQLCNFWTIVDPDQYALQFSEPKNHNYITEKNRNEIKNGSVLRLEHSPAKTVHDILSKINSGGIEEKTDALNKLSTLSSDITFAIEFINKKGLSLIINNIEQGKLKGNMLGYALVTFVELMDHGIISWDILEGPFVNKISTFINDQPATQDPIIIQSCLSILENIVLNSSGKSAQVMKEVTIPSLVKHLQVSGKEKTVIQQNTIALINALFSKADLSRRKSISATLSSKQYRNIICDILINGDISKDSSHQLYVLQTLSLGLLEARMKTKVDSQDLEAEAKLKQLRTIAFESDTHNSNPDITCRQISVYGKDNKKLGFKCEIDPIKDFNEAPPGALALDCMIYFARNHTDEYRKIVLENSCRSDEHECPFGKTSVELVKTLCDILRIGEPPNEQGQTYHPMMFTHDHSFEEFFCICIVLLNKTWKEMRATTEDFIKVFGVVKEQIIRALGTYPKSFDQFKQQLNQLTYSEITQLWQQERTVREEWESHAMPIVELKEKIMPEIIELIQMQRLAVLVSGTRFTKYSSRGQRKGFWFVRLSPNHKVLHYADCDEKSTPSLEELGTKLAVSDIKGLITGKECPHMKDWRGRKTTPQLAFSLILDSVEMGSLNFMAPDEQVFDFWTDGMNALLKEKMTSKTCEIDLKTLLSMDIKVRLLDAEGIDIPKEPPPIPSEPDNYDFYYDTK